MCPRNGVNNGVGTIWDVGAACGPIVCMTGAPALHLWRVITESVPGPGGTGRNNTTKTNVYTV